jgi:hypothetical protein
VNIKKMMKQAQQMQERLQREVAELTCEGSAGGGMVTVQMRGTKEVTQVRIAPEVIDPGDPEMLQDLILAALHEAGRKVDAQLQEKMGDLGPGLGLPG